MGEGHYGCKGIKGDEGHSKALDGGKEEAFSPLKKGFCVYVWFVQSEKRIFNGRMAKVGKTRPK